MKVTKVQVELEINEKNTFSINNEGTRSTYNFILAKNIIYSLVDPR